MRKLYLILSFVVFLLISFLGITYSYEYNDNGSLKFELIGDYELDLLLNEQYIEYGIRVIYNSDDISSKVNIDSSMVDTSRVGQYKVKYEVNIDGINEYIYRIVNVTEDIAPKIVLLGDKVMYVDLNGEYVEPGYDVIDNYDQNLLNKVIISNGVNVTKIGEYKVEYRVSDSSGNETVVVRQVIVK